MLQCPQRSKGNSPSPPSASVSPGSRPDPNPAKYKGNYQGCYHCFTKQTSSASQKNRGTRMVEGFPGTVGMKEDKAYSRTWKDHAESSPSGSSMPSDLWPMSSISALRPTSEPPARPECSRELLPCFDIVGPSNRIDGIIDWIPSCRSFSDVVFVDLPFLFNKTLALCATGVLKICCASESGGATGRAGAADV